jgi:hypothetical protein
MAADEVDVATEATAIAAEIASDEVDVATEAAAIAMEDSSK